MKKLDKEIENKEDRPQKKQDESRVNMSPGKASQGVKKLARHRFEPRFLAKTVKWANHRIARQASPERSELVVNPNRKVLAIAPNQSRAYGKRNIPKQRQ